MEVPKIYPRSSEINFKAIRSFDWEGDVLTVTDGIVNAFRDATDLQIIGHYQVDCTELREFLEAKRAGKELRPVVRGRDICDTVDGHCEFKCSVCGVELSSVYGGSNDFGLDGGYFNFCPNCGAMMEGE